MQRTDKQRTAYERPTSASTSASASTTTSTRLPRPRAEGTPRPELLPRRAAITRPPRVVAPMRVGPTARNAVVRVEDPPTAPIVAPAGPARAPHRVRAAGSPTAPDARARQSTARSARVSFTPPPADASRQVTTVELPRMTFTPPPADRAAAQPARPRRPAPRRPAPAWRNAPNPLGELDNASIDDLIEETLREVRPEPPPPLELPRAMPASPTSGAFADAPAIVLRPERSLAAVLVLCGLLAAVAGFAVVAGLATVLR